MTTRTDPKPTARTEAPEPPGDHAFDAARPRLFAIAYRMLGTRADAEDVLQDARLRAQCSDAEIAELSFVIAVINSWSLLNVSLRNPVPETP
ncbi:hypothetical protein CJO78_16190 [Ralstonia solanacearum]|nr:sigma factor [Ralstonia solanacearum]BEU73524.1 hypothetical protein MAFF211271_30790 [Ralstonia pseudosolanacearum]AMP38902.1 hypothetical protein LBM2029_15755 [Ralstonia solanacearum]AXV78303.1 hypothetical protein CJO76_15740 [Ralstonia solanacearum]AXV87729.1 hypothetical protein CJO78_16190 [Ralstonia solanacearum]AXV92327.1 hypothetical protein CJO79_15720 [Ralstonia solanacearum]